MCISSISKIINPIIYKQAYQFYMNIHNFNSKIHTIQQKQATHTMNSGHMKDFQKSPRTGLKNRTCPGKTGRMVTLGAMPPPRGPNYAPEQHPKDSLILKRNTFRI